ncbi:hypothetical protein C8J57DRAFT_1398969, partial [Mycena rebaudengoi]
MNTLLHGCIPVILCIGLVNTFKCCIDPRYILEHSTARKIFKCQCCHNDINFSNINSGNCCTQAINLFSDYLSALVVQHVDFCHFCHSISQCNKFFDCSQI